MLDRAGVDRLATMSKICTVPVEEGLQLWHVLALKDVPHSACASIPAPETVSIQQICTSNWYLWATHSHQHFVSVGTTLAPAICICWQQTCTSTPSLLQSIGACVSQADTARYAAPPRQHLCTHSTPQKQKLPHMLHRRTDL